MRVRIRGVIYDTVREAADANNVSTAAVYTAIRIGDPDKIGTRGRRNLTEETREALAALAAYRSNKPITIAGVWFPSRKELGRVVNMTQKGLREAINGSQASRDRLEERVRKATAIF